MNNDKISVFFIFWQRSRVCTVVKFSALLFIIALVNLLMITLYIAHYPPLCICCIVCSAFVPNKSNCIFIFELSLFKFSL